MVQERVQKIIAASGFCSRRKAEELIELGKVTVNGVKITIGDKADPNDIIKVGNRQIEQEERVYFMLNKPRGFITTNSDLYDRKKVVDLIDVPERIFPVGRLDRDATGLLLLTNDGDWANKVMHPRYELEKEYEAELDRIISKEDVAKLNKGIMLKDGFVKPTVHRKAQNYCIITLHEGRNKIVKRIFNELGYRVIQLKRTRIGPYSLGRMKFGEWKEFTPKDKEKKKEKPKSKSLKELRREASKL